MLIIFGVQIFMNFPPKHAFYLTVYLTVTCDPVLDIEDDPLKFWKDNEAEYPCLSKLANKYLAIQASSAAVERLFSIGGKVYRTDMCRLKDETLKG